MGVPKLGNGDTLKGLEVLGKIPAGEVEHLSKPAETSATWTNDAGVTVELVEPPPPWELEDKEIPESDARRFVKVPDNWVLYWINPRALDHYGWRDWQPVMASDPRVKCHVPLMVTPDNNIRRGGPGGDILAWMYRGWYESRKKRAQVRIDNQNASSVSRMETLREDFKRGKYGPYVTLEGSRHPTHTGAEGRSMTD